MVFVFRCVFHCTYGTYMYTYCVSHCVFHYMQMHVMMTMKMMMVMQMLCFHFSHSYHRLFANIKCLHMFALQHTGTVEGLISLVLIRCYHEESGCIVSCTNLAPTAFMAFKELLSGTLQAQALQVLRPWPGILGAQALEEDRPWQQWRQTSWVSILWVSLAKHCRVPCKLANQVKRNEGAKIFFLVEFCWLSGGTVDMDKHVHDKLPVQRCCMCDVTTVVMKKGSWIGVAYTNCQFWKHRSVCAQHLKSIQQHMCSLAL